MYGSLIGVKVVMYDCGYTLVIIYTDIEVCL